MALKIDSPLLSLLVRSPRIFAEASFAASLVFLASSPAVLASCIFQMLGRPLGQGNFCADFE